MFRMKVQVASVITFAVLTSVGCGSSEQRDGELGSKTEDLSRTGIVLDGKSNVVTDSGVADTSKPLLDKLAAGGAYQMDPAPSGPTSCAPQRWDIVAEGRTCFDF